MTPTEMIIRAHLGIPIEDLAAMKRLFKLMKNVKGGRAQDSSHILHWPMLVNDPVPMSSQLKKFTRFYEFFGLKVVVSPKALKKLKLKS
ncbi:uncharacterized protein MELLADRAFT_71837 [Melampsora larici-populina 98AG31]|uniref:Uncharacterized protein n=1 Tax=Melampsora larici-populina (strain 98AG31 / pathotype 3-4-7) TaxID=747676 RepID=F4RKY4_MELLP|nr:uncharacterized protein MELLADRAFT_71837 [Melampsora larici-populina 98AG31]EGG06805.1 hypothetical protein MELLADRAFT_71837 [Melampsora larici-populina 98AG31]